jgi:hypothetical protein
VTTRRPHQCERRRGVGVVGDSVAGTDDIGSGDSKPGHLAKESAGSLKVAVRPAEYSDRSRRARLMQRFETRAHVSAARQHNRRGEPPQKNGRGAGWCISPSTTSPRRAQKESRFTLKTYDLPKKTVGTGAKIALNGRETQNTVQRQTCTSREPICGGLEFSPRGARRRHYRLRRDRLHCVPSAKPGLERARSAAQRCRGGRCLTARDRSIAKARVSIWRCSTRDVSS